MTYAAPADPHPDAAASGRARRASRAVWCLCLVAALRVLVFGAAFPFFNNIDEQPHFDLIHKYARGHWPSAASERADDEVARISAIVSSPEFGYPPEAFPGAVYPPPSWARPRGEADRYVAAQHRVMARAYNHEAFSPPTYYLLAAGWLLAGRSLGAEEIGLLYWMRGLNVLLVVALVRIAWHFTRRWYADRPEVHLGVPALLACMPLDIYYGLNSDVLSPPLFSAGLLLLFSWQQEEEPPSITRSALLGGLVAATFLVKYSNLALPLLLLTGLWLRLRRGATPANLRAIASAALAAALPVAAWFAYCFAKTGSFTGTAAKVAILGWKPTWSGAWQHPLFTPSGFWTFWSDLIANGWRGEMIWHGERIAAAGMDAFYVATTTLFLAVAAASQLLGPRAESRERRSTSGLLLACVALSTLQLAGLSLAFDFGDAIYPSAAYPYFTSARLVSGAVLPLLVLWSLGLRTLVRALPGVDDVSAGKLAVAVQAASCVAMLASEITLSAGVFSSSYNLFHAFSSVPVP